MPLKETEPEILRSRGLEAAKTGGGQDFERARIRKNLGMPDTTMRVILFSHSRVAHCGLQIVNEGHNCVVGVHPRYDGMR